MPVDICMEALASNATFIARSFAGNPKQVKELLKAAIAHNGIAVLDIISPCVTFNNQENAYHSYAGARITKNLCTTLPTSRRAARSSSKRR